MLNTKALAASVSAPPKVYVEDVFSTWLYTGNDSTQTITNGIDLSGKGGLTWIKNRVFARNHWLFDTARGATNALNTDTTNAQAVRATALTAFNSNGFTLNSDAQVNGSPDTYASWTFRKAAKFFDVVTYTGTGSNRTIAHNLGSVPGCIMVKRTDTTGDWQVYHRANTANPETDYLVLNSTAATVDSDTRWNDTLPTSTVFSLGTEATVNASGGTYVAYLFAHDAGGFGDAGTDSVVKCGTFTCDGSGNVGTVDLGWEPQWILTKRTNTTQSWHQWDNMRGWALTSSSTLSPNLADAEIAYGGTSYLYPTATGFAGSGNFFGPNAQVVYIAIRRGPMKTPTDATKVFGLNARTGTGADATVTGGQVDDAVLIKNRGSAVGDLFAARVTGTGYLETSSTAAEVAAGTTILQANPWDVMDGVKVGTTSTITNASSNTFINYLFRRAPGFFDVVAYAGTGSATTVSHNLGVVPELMLVKCRSVGTFWRWYWAPLGATKNFYMPNDEASVTQTEIWNNTSPTSTVFTVGTSTDTNFSTRTYIAYLFASITGISKIGSYTGTGTTLNIDCGFTAGARFVMIKRSDSTGDWYIWDTAQGIVSGNDPYLLLNSTAAEVTNTDYIDPLSSGFQISSTAPAAINANGGSYIYLSIA